MFASHYSLDPNVLFLNHGSFGATPRAVQEEAARLREEMERQPVFWMSVTRPALVEAARARLGAFVGGGQDLVFVPNATQGVNVVAASLAGSLLPGDEVLGTDHEYGACANAWEAACARAEARYVRAAVPLPDEVAPGSALESRIVEAMWERVTDRTRVLFMSHITSPTAQRWPVEKVIERARAAGILTVIDGAHAPGMLDLNLAELGADFYTGNCHKWLSAPKSAGFLHARPEVQQLLRPLVVSWGSPPERQFDTGNGFRDAFVWAGTLDDAAYLAVPAAIDFHTEVIGGAVRAQRVELLRKFLPRLARAAGCAPVYGGGDATLPPQMAISPLPAGVDVRALKARLLEHFRIEIPVIAWRGRAFVRVSVAAYTTAAELEVLERALAELAPG